MSWYVYACLYICCIHLGAQAYAANTFAADLLVGGWVLGSATLVRMAQYAFVYIYIVIVHTYKYIYKYMCIKCLHVCMDIFNMCLSACTLLVFAFVCIE